MAKKLVLLTKLTGDVYEARIESTEKQQENSEYRQAEEKLRTHGSQLKHS